MTLDSDPRDAAAPRPAQPSSPRRVPTLARTFRLVSLHFQPLYDDEPTGMISLLVVIDPLLEHVRWVEPMRCPLARKGALARILRHACHAPLQGRPGVPLGVTTPDRAIALGLHESMPELAVSLDEGPLPERLAIEASFLALAAL